MRNILKTRVLLCAVVLLLVGLGSALPASAAGWTDKTSAWNLPSAGRLIANGNDLYWFSGTTVKELTGNSWTTLTPSGAASSYGWSWNHGSTAQNVNGEFYFFNGNESQSLDTVDVFNPAANSGQGSWTNITPTAAAGPILSGGSDQGAVYNPIAKTYSAYAYTYIATYWQATATYDLDPSHTGTYQTWSVTTGSAPTPNGWTPISVHYGPNTDWSSTESINVGNVNYVYAGGQYHWASGGAVISFTTYDFSTQKLGTTASYTASANVAGPAGTNIGYCLMEAALNGKIYVAGLNSNVFLEYDPNAPAGSQWTDLTSATAYVHPATCTGNMDHSIVATPNGLIYVEDGTQYWVYNTTPEPATLALLAIGGIGMVIRRRRTA